MITDDVRRETAKKLREKKKEFFGERSWFPQDLTSYQSMYLTAIDECLPDGECGFDVLADLIEPEPVTGDTSDGFHTFDELYRHRAVLFSFIVTCFPGASWKSMRHHDGTMYDGMFIVGIETPWGQATYHYDAEPYWDMFPCEELDRAPEWDGHTPDQAIERIERLAQRLADARVGERAEIRSCWNVNDKDAGEAGKRGFKCSACGEVFKDGERYLTGGTWKYCPRCEGMVMRLI